MLYFMFWKATLTAFRLQVIFLGPVATNLILRPLNMLHFPLHDEQTYHSHYSNERATFWLTGVRNPAGPIIFVLTSMSRQTWGVICQPSTRVPVFLTMEWNLSQREADQLSPHRVEISNAWTYTYIPPIRLPNHGTESQGHIEIICINSSDGRGKPGW
jgi:hypothetical protein